jgi:outer membrane immunogenic protein
MQKTLAVAVFAALLGVCGPAGAADIYSGGSLKDGPVYVPETSWTGFYVGLGVGGASINHDITASGFGSSVELNGVGGEGVFGTVEVGYDRQFGRFVGGVFFNYDFSDVSTDLKINFPGFGATYSIDLNSMWSVGGRGGYLVSPNTLVYALAAYTEADLSFPFGLKSGSFSGYSVGGGLETKLGGNWFLKGEYRFTRLDTQTLVTFFGGKVTDDIDVQSARLVLSYKADLFGHDFVPLK